jgi:hypothetical protein
MNITNAGRKNQHPASVARPFEVCSVARLHWHSYAAPVRPATADTRVAAREVSAGPNASRFARTVRTHSKNVVFLRLRAGFGFADVIAY